MLRVYLAHNYAAKEWLATKVVPVLENTGKILVTSRWIIKYPTSDDAKNATDDLYDVSIADVLVLFTDQFEEIPGKGKFLEAGYALGLDKQLICFGTEKSNDSSIFFKLPNVFNIHSQNIDDLVTVLSAMRFPMRSYGI